MTDIEYSLRPAIGADVAKVTVFVHAANGHYVEGIGVVPRPMTEDYAEVIKNYRVTVAESHQTIVGVIALAVTDEGFLIDNVAVDPSYRGRGLGKALLQFAEAEARSAIAIYSRFKHIGAEHSLHPTRGIRPGRMS